MTNICADQKLWQFTTAIIMLLSYDVHQKWNMTGVLTLCIFVDSCPRYYYCKRQEICCPCLRLALKPYTYFNVRAQSDARTPHYGDVIMGAIASQITSLTIVYSTVYSNADQRKHQSSAPLAFVRGIHRGPVNSPHKWRVTRKMFPFDDVIMKMPKIPCNP